MFSFVFNKLPWNGDLDKEIWDKIIKEDLVLPDDEEIDSQLTDLIKGMLDKDVSKRLTLDQLKTNNWLNDGFHYNLD